MISCGLLLMMLYRGPGRIERKYGVHFFASAGICWFLTLSALINLTQEKVIELQIVDNGATSRHFPNDLSKVLTPLFESIAFLFHVRCAGVYARHARMCMIQHTTDNELGYS